MEMHHLLKSASAEIRALRRHNELLAAQVGVIEVFRAATMGTPKSQGYAEDVAWRLDIAADELMKAAADVETTAEGEDNG